MDFLNSQGELRGFDVCIDKGTFDAISLNPDNSKEGKKLYIQTLKDALKDKGFFSITSCNWTKEQLLERFTEGEVKQSAWTQILFCIMFKNCIIILPSLERRGMWCGHSRHSSHSHKMCICVYIYVCMGQCDNLEKNIRAAQCCNYKNGRNKRTFFFQQCIDYSERGAAHITKRVSRKLLLFFKLQYTLKPIISLSLIQYEVSVNYCLLNKIIWDLVFGFMRKIHSVWLFDLSNKHN